MGGGIKLRKIWSMPYLPIFLIFFFFKPRLGYFSPFGSFLPQIYISRGRFRIPESPGWQICWWYLGKALRKFPNKGSVHFPVTGAPAKGRFGTRSRCSSMSPGPPGAPRAGSAARCGGCARPAPPAEIAAFGKAPGPSLGKGWGRAGGVDQLRPRSRPSAAGAKITHWGLICVSASQSPEFSSWNVYFCWLRVLFWFGFSLRFFVFWVFFFFSFLYMRGGQRWRSRRAAEQPRDAPAPPRWWHRAGAAPGGGTALGPPSVGEMRLVALGGGNALAAGAATRGLPNTFCCC